MRKILTATILGAAALLGAPAVAGAAPLPAPRLALPHVQTVEWGRPGDGWRAHEWRRHEAWEHERRREAWLRWHRHHEWRERQSYYGRGW